MATKQQKDALLLDVDAETEIVANVVHRRKDRKPHEYIASQLVFFQSLFSLVECLVPGCKGHQRYAYSAADNIAAFFRYHDSSTKEAIYIPFKSPLSRPLRIPQDGDELINGIRWGLFQKNSIVNCTQGIFDCLLASLKIQTMLKRFCLECIFMHTNGIGQLLEKIIKTALLHIVPYGRYVDKENFFPVTRYEQGLTLRFRRIFWGENDKLFVPAYVSTKNGFSEKVIYMDPNSNIGQYPVPFRQKPAINLNFSVLRHLDEISTFNVVVSCGCNSGNMRIKKSHVGILRKNSRCGVFNLALGEWNQKHTSYEDPILNWTLFGNEGPNASVTKITATPLAHLCPSCQNLVSVRQVDTPDTTWLLMAEMAESLSKTSLAGLSAVSTVVLGGVNFRLAFVLLYNTTSGAFTSMNYQEGVWSYYEDGVAGLLRQCNADKVRYKDKINLRVYYIRETSTDPHRCLMAAHKRS